MNKLLLISLLLLSFTVSAQKIDRKTLYEYSENVEFRIFGLAKNKTVDRGAGGQNIAIIKAEKDRRFVTIVFEFKNNSSETQKIDFENIFIQDQNKKPHKVDLVVVGMKLGVGAQKLQQKIKAGKKSKIIAQFMPSFDENELIKTLIINGQTIELAYK